MAARRTACWVLSTAAMMVTALHNPGSVGATPAVRFAATTILSRRFDKDEALSQSIVPDSSEDDRRAKVWLSEQKTAGPSDLYVQSNVWQPGGSTGWHTHPGNSLIFVAAGTVTEYESSDRECKPHVYSKGMRFLDPRGDHAHIVRNEGDTVARTIAVQLIPAGVARRIDAADPGTCHF